MEQMMRFLTFLVAITTIERTHSCTDTVIQTCKNCGPGPDCYPSFDTETDILQSSTCQSNCESNTSCSGAWFSYSPGQLGQCDYYNCTQLQQSAGFTFHRKTCLNGPECLEYELFRYEESVASCFNDDNTTLTLLNSSSEYECLEECLDTQDCRSVTYNNGTCTLHTCDTSVPGTDFTFWKRVCLQECENTTIQRCTNCGPSTTGAAFYQNLTELFPSTVCAEACENTTDCSTSFYNMSDNSCVLFPEGGKVDMDVNGVSFRKSCTSECSDYELFKLDNSTGGCDPFEVEAHHTNAQHCLQRCLDMPSCLSVMFDDVESTCSYFNCTEYTAGAGNSVFYWRNCLDACDRNYTQTCVNCEASSDCSPMIEESIYSSIDCTNLCTMTNSCNMAVFEPSESSCKLYECTSVNPSFGKNAQRKTCSDECLQYSLEVISGSSIQCQYFSYDTGGVDLSFCITRCLDMDGCEGITYVEHGKSCRYHNCSDVDVTAIAESSVITAVRRLCISEDPVRNYTQVCLNCEINSPQTCPRYIERPANYIMTECNEICHNTTGCTSAVFEYGKCSLYDCTHVRQSYGDITYRLTYNPECLEYTINTLDGHFGTCDIIDVTSEYSDYIYCLDKCLDFAGCMGITFISSNQSCWLHSCGESNATSDEGSTDIIFVERQCNPQSCDRLYEQECINCDIHDKCRWSFHVYNTAITSNCSHVCESIEACGASIYDPTRSLCKLYNHTGLQMEWGKSAFRKSCRSDCPKFKLTQMSNTIGSCNVTGTHYGIPTLDDCLHLCLDTTNCFGTTFYENKLTCTLHECETSEEANGTESATFVFLNCNVQECSKDHSQVCTNCGTGPNCQMAIEKIKYVSLPSECEVACDQSFNCLSSYFNMPDGECLLLNCGQMTGGLTYLKYHRVYRKSCTNDCPLFEIYISPKTAGSDCVDISDSGLDAIPSIYYCLEACLDIPNCRSVTYNHNASMCTYHMNCTETLSIADHSYATRVCVDEDPPAGDIIQTCINCGKGPDCPHYFDTSGSSVYFDYDCENLCSNRSYCLALQYNTYWPQCIFYHCGQVTQNIGQTTYRRTHNTDCPVFELFIYHGCRGDCPTIGSTRVNGPEFCMELCLDIEGCRGITYNDTTNYCAFHNCTDITVSSSFSFIKRVCSEDFDVCNRTELQTCHDCSKGPTCQKSFDHVWETTPRSVNTSVVGFDPDYKQIWYDRSSSKTRYVYCSEVDMAVGNIVHRATCTNDCTDFKIYIHTKTKGNCSTVLSTLTGGVTLHYCISKCLDRPGCRALTYDNVGYRCDLYTDCNDYSPHVNYTFFRRTCMDEVPECVANTTQTCLNCAVSSHCQSPYQTSSQKHLIEDCYALKLTEIESDAVGYHTYNNQCAVYQCSMVDFSINALVYRDSCDSDCPKYELFRKNNFEGTCDIIGEDSGSVTIEYCLEQCADMTGCRGVTFYGNTSHCYYHGCANTTDYLVYRNTTFIERRCVTEECSRDYTQVCLNCQKGLACQDHFKGFPGLPTWQECYNETLGLEHAGLVYYNDKGARCLAFNCSLVHYSVQKILLRKSCSSDCPVYRLAYLYGYKGSCPVIDQDEGGVTMEYCMGRCLDMPDCMAISFSSLNSSLCLYHSCTDKTNYESDWAFYWRECVNDTQENVLDPIKPYTQKCLNCDTQCHVPISNQTAITRDGDCNITCPGCNMVQYVPTEEICYQFYCDEIYAPIGASIMYRKTNNSECLEFEVFFYSTRQAQCEVMEYDEGLYDLKYCLERCLDKPGCLSVAYSDSNCTLYACNNHTQGASFNYFMEKVCTDDTGHLLQSSLSCNCPQLQTCVNCDIDAAFCQSPYSTTSDESISDEESLCTSACMNDAYCEAVVSNGGCDMYQCDVVTPRNDTDSTLYRKICFPEDCPIYEIHKLTNHFGACDVMRTEEIQFNVELCFERCLRMPGCRGVTYWGRLSTCYYHSCDCGYDFVDAGGFDAIFMWRYCLHNASMSTLNVDLNQTSPPKLYLDCLSTTTVTTTTLMSTTQTPLVVATANSTVFNTNITTVIVTSSSTQASNSTSVAPGSSSTLSGPNSSSSSLSAVPVTASSSAAPASSNSSVAPGLSSSSPAPGLSSSSPAPGSASSSPASASASSSPAPGSVSSSSAPGSASSSPAPRSVSFSPAPGSASSSPAPGSASSSPAPGSVSSSPAPGSASSSPAPGSASSSPAPGSASSSPAPGSASSSPAPGSASTSPAPGSASSSPAPGSSSSSAAPGSTSSSVIPGSSSPSVPPVPPSPSVPGSSSSSVALSSSNSSPALNTASSSAAPGSTNLTTASSLATSTAAPGLSGIYIRPCLCSTGSFGNLSTEEISLQLVHNLTISKDDTGASRRRLISIKDNRQSAITIGSAGVVTLALELSTLLLIDSSRILQGLHVMHNLVRNLRI